MLTANKNQRAQEIDGIRGWAAMVVLLFHLFYETFGAVLPWTRNPGVFAVLNGPLAVFVFFVLSGDALSIGYLASGRRQTLDSLAVRRYLRLTIPIAISTFVLLVLISSGLVFNKSAGLIVESGWLASFLNFEPSIASYLRYVLIEVYSPAKVYGAPATQYNPMLWTMPVELAGSVLILLFWYLSPGLNRVHLVLFGVTLLLAALGSYYALFFIGMALSILRQKGTLDLLRAHAGWQVAAPILFLISIFGHGMLGNQAGVRHLTILSAAVIVFCAYTSNPLLWIFRSAPSRFLGHISFPLYLIHLSVIVSFTSWWILDAGTISQLTAIWICVGSIAVTLVVSAVFRHVEQTTLRLVDRQLIALLVTGPTASKTVISS